MQAQLASMGIHLQLEPIPSFKGHFPLNENGVFIDDQDHAAAEMQNTASSHTVGRSAYADGPSGEHRESLGIQIKRPSKRLRVDSPLPATNIHGVPSSRDMMPPPSKPPGRMKSIRNIIPSIRNRISHGRLSPVKKRPSHEEPELQIYDNGRWEDVCHSRPSSIREEMASLQGPSQEVLMSGALPPDDDRQPILPLDSKAITSSSRHGNQSEFTFSAPSPIMMRRNGPAELPTEPSYVRLLDGLGRHDGLDLGLEDPRSLVGTERRVSHQDAPSSYQAGRVSHPQQHQRQAELEDNVEYLPINPGPVPTYRRVKSDQSTMRAKASLGGRSYQPVDPITPAPAHFQRQIAEIDHVVSPYFGSGGRKPQPFPHSQVAEPEASFIRSAAYRSCQRPTSRDMDWQEPRSLNGLSFFNSPMNEHNEPIGWEREPRASIYMAPSPHRIVRNIDSQGFLTRPDAKNSPRRPFLRHDSFDRPYGRPDLAHTDHRTSNAPSNHPVYRSTTRLSSALPSMMPRYSLARENPQFKTLTRTGVRSSQSSRPLAPRVSHPMSASNAPWRVERRSIRR